MSSLFNLIHLLSTGGLLLTTFLLFSKPKQENWKANILLSVFLFFLFLAFLDECFVILSIDNEGYILEELLSIVFFLMPPTFYLSVRYFAYPLKKITKKDLLHFLPAFCFTLLIVVLLLFSTVSVPTNSIQSLGNYVSILVILTVFLQVIIYSALSLKLIQSHQKNIYLFTSNTEEINLAWIQKFILGVIFFGFLWLIQINLPELPNFYSIGYFLGVYYLAYFALNQKELYPFSESDTLEIAEILESKEDTSNASILIPDLTSEKNKLDELMNHEKPYLDNELTLPKLAHLFQTNTHQLSYLLNNGFKENFYDYVNRHRVEESKKLLMDKKFAHLSMVGIAYEAGFNSKTTFNTAFKKFTGYTPSEYKKVNSQ